MPRGDVVGATVRAEADHAASVAGRVVSDRKYVIERRPLDGGAWTEAPPNIGRVFATREKAEAYVIDVLTPAWPEFRHRVVWVLP